MPRTHCSAVLCIREALPPAPLPGYCWPREVIDAWAVLMLGAERLIFLVQAHSSGVQLMLPLTRQFLQRFLVKVDCSPSRTLGPPNFFSALLWKKLPPPPPPPPFSFHRAGTAICLQMWLL